VVVLPAASVVLIKNDFDPSADVSSAPPFLPPPSATLAAPPVAVLLEHFAVPRRQPPARGPPRLI